MNRKIAELEIKIEQADFFADVEIRQRKREIRGERAFPDAAFVEKKVMIFDSFTPPPSAGAFGFAPPAGIFWNSYGAPENSGDLLKHRTA